MKHAVGDEEGNLREFGSFPTPNLDVESLLREMSRVYGQAAASCTIRGVAVSCPGAVDWKAGVIHGTSAVPCIHQIPFRAMLSSRFPGIPLFIENDARCFAWGELWKGSAVGSRHFSAITIGSGIGGAMVHDGRVLHGAHLCCGEVSNFPIGEQMQDGSRGKWSDYTPVNLAKQYGAILGRPLTGQQLFEMADAGDRTAKDYLDRFYYYTALGCILIQFAFDPERIVVGGGVSRRKGLAECLDRKMEEILPQKANYGFLKPVLVISRDDNQSNLRGALYCLLGQSEEGNGCISV